MVNRKSSTGPTVPPTSRTNSSTPSPTLKAKKGGLADPPLNNSPLRTNVSIAVDPAKDPVGPEFDDPPKFIEKRNSPQRQVAGRHAYMARSATKESSGKKLMSERSRKQNHSLAKTLLKTSQVLILGGLVAHTTIVCPQDVHLDSALCRTMHDFQAGLRQHIFEPHVYPQLEQALAYPPVARVYQPLAQALKPIVERAKPVAKEASIHANAIYLAFGDILYGAAQPYAVPMRRKYDEFISPIAQQYLVQPYQEYAQPFLLAVDQYGQVAGRRVEPYLFHAASALRRTKDEAQPYLAIAWSETLKLPGLIQAHAWEPMKDLRRTYVDPPVSKMVQALQEKADEASTGEDVTQLPIAQNQVETEDVPKGTSTSAVFESTQPHSVAAGANTARPQLTDPPQALVDQAHERDGNLVDEDLEAFLQELTSSATELEAEPEPTLSPVLQTESAEDAEERRQIREAETAEKRHAITGRHDVWEQKLRALSESHIDRFPTTLAELRQGAVSNLESYRHAETVEADAERALRNTEAFVKRLVAQDGSLEDKVRKLEDLVAKVKKRFEDGASVLSDSIVEWWQSAQAAEHDEIEKVVRQVRDLGTDAQGDLGLDYSWLDDVTVHDWARYHELLEVSKRLQERMTQMLNGVDQDAPPVNFLSQALQDLQVELQGLVVRFQTRLSNVHRQGVESIMGPPL